MTRRDIVTLLLIAAGLVAVLSFLVPWGARHQGCTDAGGVTGPRSCYYNPSNSNSSDFK